MNSFRTAFIGVTGKKVQSLIVFIIILIILLFELTGLLIHYASKAAEQDVYKQTGISIAIAQKHTFTDNQQIQRAEQEIDNSMIKNLVSKEHVAGYDSLLESYCTPVNFKNVKLYTGINPATQNNQADETMEEITKEKDQVCLIGGINIKYNDRFYKNQNTLIKGSYPDQDHEGAIITEELSKANSLDVGDTISVNGADTRNSIDLKIIGIYKTNLKFEIFETNYLGEGLFNASPYNTIYTNYKAVNFILDSSCPVYSLTVWVDSPQYVQTLMNDINGDKTWSNFDVFNLTSSLFNEYCGQLKSTNEISKYLITLSILFGAMLLIITMTFFANNYIYETGLYTVLGSKKIRILTIQFLQAFFIVVAALLVSLILSPFITFILNNLVKVNYISANSAATISCFNNGELDIKQNFHITLTPDVFLGMAFALLIIATVSVFIPLLAALRLKPGEILAGNKKG